MVLKTVVLCVLALTSDVITMYRDRKSEGYSNGFMSDCPGVTKEAIISKESLKKIALHVQTDGNWITSRRRKYTYYQMKALAKDPELDFSRRTMLYVGGFLDSPAFPVASTFGEEYKKLGYNILLLDTNYFGTIDLPLASRIMRTAAKHAAEMLVELTNLGLDPKKLEMIGLSLGGQTASFVAKNYKSLTGVTIGRLTGLDPAGTCFRNLGPEDRIDDSDADFVDILGTNIDTYGMAAPVGHVNIYSNGGEHQPGELVWYFCSSMCSHMRAFQMWVAAIQNPNKFIAIQCDSMQEARDRRCYGKENQVTNVLGLNTDPSKRGIFYLTTSNKYPYYQGEKGLKEENDFFISKFKAVNESAVMELEI